MIQRKTRRRMASQMNKYMGLYQRTETKNAMGEPVSSDVKFADVWVVLWPVSAKEYIQNGRESMDVSHRIRMRYLSGVIQSMVFKLGAREFEIVEGPLNLDESNKLMDFVVREKL